MNTATLQLLNEHACFGGVQRYHQHDSAAIGLPMRFSVYLPPQASTHAVPAVVYLAGLTCNEETFMAKAAAAGCQCTVSHCVTVAAGSAQ